MKKLIVNGEEVYLEDEKLDEKETGVLIPYDDIEKDNDKEQVNEKDLLENTLTDIWGDNNG